MGALQPCGHRAAGTETLTRLLHASIRSAYDMAAILLRGWDAETNNSVEVRCGCARALVPERCSSDALTKVRRTSQCYRDDAVMAYHMQNDTTEQYVQVRAPRRTESWRLGTSLRCALRCGAQLLTALARNVRHCSGCAAAARSWLRPRRPQRRRRR